MQNSKYRWIKYLQWGFDLVVINGAFLAATALRFSDLRIDNDQYYNYYVQLWVFMNLSWILVTQVLKTYSLKPTTEIRNSLSKGLNALVFQLFIFTLLIVSLKGYYYSRLFLIYFYSLLIPLIAITRILFLNWWRNYLKDDKNARYILLLGNSPQAQALFTNLEQHPEYGLRVKHWEKELKDPSEVAVHGVSEVYCSYQQSPELVATWHKYSEAQLLRFRFLPELGIPLLTQADVDFLGDSPIVYPRPEPLSYRHNQMLKRAFDLLISALFLVGVAPWLFPLIILSIALDSRGPILFRQKRTGINNKTFSCLKFRSMARVENASVQAIKGDQRVTRVGRWLRRHNLDELPQVFNVVAGQMSIVGPRPHMIAHTEQYKTLIDAYMVRHLILPGLTGLAQSQGLRGETSDPQKMQARVRADVYYLENWSLLLDTKIILITALNMLLGKFKGN